MAKNKIGLEVEGFEELISNLDKLQGNVKGAVEECLNVAEDVVSRNTKSAMGKHNRTGKTGGSIIETSPVKWEGMTASIDVGFQFPEGLASVFLMYGTPRNKKDTNLYNAIYGKKTKDEIANKQEQILAKEINKAMGG